MVRRKAINITTATTTYIDSNIDKRLSYVLCSNDIIFAHVIPYISSGIPWRLQQFVQNDF
eukprot:scaffold503272_cov14-Prasinocladus_malaysianus.AAC.1